MKKGICFLMMAVMMVLSTAMVVRAATNTQIAHVMDGAVLTGAATKDGSIGVVSVSNMGENSGNYAIRGSLCKNYNPICEFEREIGYSLNFSESKTKYFLSSSDFMLAQAYVLGQVCGVYAMQD